MARLEQELPRLDLSINNAGVAGSGEVGVFPLEDWRWLLDINLLGPIHGCHTCRDWLLRSPGSHVVNVASVAAFTTVPGLAAYNVSKAGVSSHCPRRCMPNSMAVASGVTVACPGYFPLGNHCHRPFSAVEHRALGETNMQHAGLSPDDVADGIVPRSPGRKLYLVIPRSERYPAFAAAADAHDDAEDGRSALWSDFVAEPATARQELKWIRVIAHSAEVSMALSGRSKS